MIKIIYRYLYAYEFFSNGRSKFTIRGYYMENPYSEIGGMKNIKHIELLQI